MNRDRRSQKLYFFLTMVLMVTVLSACDPKKDFKLLYSERSPDGTVELEVYFSETMAFGPHDIKIFARTDSSEKLVLDERLYNDGRKPGKSNVTISWESDHTATISLNGQEQNKTAYTVNL